MYYEKTSKQQNKIKYDYIHEFLNNIHILTDLYLFIKVQKPIYHQKRNINIKYIITKCTKGISTATNISGTR